MKQIDISTPKYPNTFTMVSDSDYAKLNRHKWGVQKGSSNKLYVSRRSLVDGKRKIIRMHIVIMGKIDGMEIDHRDGNGLNNQRNNLRHCTHAQNLSNQGVPVHTKSGYKGVRWHKVAKKWNVQIQHDGKAIHIGSFFCLIKAAKAYDKKAIDLFGEYARLNFPQ